MLIDLHIHTNYSSDGELPPEEIFARVEEKQIRYYSIADHNTVNGYLKLSEKYRVVGDITLIPAVEFSTFLDEHEIHVLSYGVNIKDASLKKAIDIINANKMKQAEERVKALRKLGFTIDLNALIENAGKNVPSGVTFLNTLLSYKENQKLLQEYISGSKSDSPYTKFYFDHFAKGGKAHVHVPLIDIREFFEIMNGKAIFSLAHPKLYPDHLLKPLMEYPFDCIEVFSSYHNTSDIDTYKKLADEYGLGYTAGSDFHGPKVKPGIDLGVDTEYNERIIDYLLDNIHKRGLSVFYL